MRVFVFVLAAVTALGSESSQERGKRVVNECLEALGGKNYLSMRDRTESGRAYSFYREELNGFALAKIYTLYLPPTNQPNALAVRERQTFGKKEDSSVLFDEREAWEITFRGARPIAAERFERYKRSTLHDIFYILRERLNEPGLIFEARGAEVYANQPVEVVEITDSANETTTVYFDQITKLPVRQTFHYLDPVSGQRDVEVTVFSKYREVGNGVKWPFTELRERNGEKVYEIFSEAVNINQGRPDQMFQLPSNVRKLKPEPSAPH